MAYRLLEVVPGAPALARRFDSPMVGRTRELALLESAFSRAVREQSCHLFTVLGPAGVGKSRLVSEALAGIGDARTGALRNLSAVRRGNHFLASARDREAADRERRRRLGGGGAGEDRGIASRRARRRDRCRARRGARRARGDARRGRGRLLGRAPPVRGDAHDSSRSSSSSTISTGPSRRCSISSSTLPTGRATHRSCSWPWPDQTCSTHVPPGGAASTMRRRSSSSRSPKTSRSASWRGCSGAVRSTPRRSPAFRLRRRATRCSSRR